MGKLFGTDGIRGIANQNLDCALSYRIGQAAALTLAKNKQEKPVVVIGKDTRISSDMLESALVAGLCACGCDVICLGVIPTPAIAYLTVDYQADAGIVISASHNPYEYKLFVLLQIFNAFLNDSEPLMPDAVFSRLGPKQAKQIQKIAPNTQPRLAWAIVFTNQFQNQLCNRSVLQIRIHNANMIRQRKILSVTKAKFNQHRGNIRRLIVKGHLVYRTLRNIYERIFRYFLFTVIRKQKATGRAAKPQECALLARIFHDERPPFLPILIHCKNGVNMKIL